MQFKILMYLFLAVTSFGIAVPNAALAGEKRVIVGYHKKPGRIDEAVIYAKRGKISRTLKRLRAMAVKLPSEEIAILKQDPNVAYIEEDVRIQAIDPMYAAEYNASWGVEHIGSATVHDAGFRGAGVKIAVLDTGIDYNHPEFQNSYRGGIDFVNSDADPMDDNSWSHGTHIAGVIAAAQDGVGVVGVAPEAELYAIKVIEGSGFGSLSHIVAGIDWAIDNQVNIINMSLGFGTTDYQSLRDACDAAYAAGILVVAATGNSYGAEVQYPAAYQSVIAVNGTDPTDQNAAFSAFGPEVELTAPSTGIFSTVIGGYSSLFGTSQASAHVSGAAALMISAGMATGITNEEVRFSLQQSAIDLGEMSRDSVFGFGRVDVPAALAAYLPPEPPTDVPVTKYHIQITREAKHGSDDAQSINLPAGKYLVRIKNDGLKNLSFLTSGYDNYHRNLWFKSKRNQIKRFILKLREENQDVILTPKGKIGTSAQVTITKINSSERHQQQVSARLQ